MIYPRRLIPALLVLLSGCATLGDQLRDAWQCNATFRVGDTVGSSYRNIHRDGTPGASRHSWESPLPGVEADILMEQPGFDEDRPWIVVDLTKASQRRVFGVELRAGDGSTSPSDPHLRIRARQSQYVLTPSRHTLAALPRPVWVVGFDRQERVVFRIPIDPDVVMRGTEAMAGADALSLEATRDYQRVCQRLTDAVLVIA